MIFEHFFNLFRMILKIGTYRKNVIHERILDTYVYIRTGIRTGTENNWLTLKNLETGTFKIVLVLFSTFRVPKSVMTTRLEFG